MTEIIKQIVESLKLLRQSQMVSQQSVEIVNKRIDDLENKINNLLKR
jgi:polyhydroxyalkanoate synthesis regulator phasin